MGRAPKAKVILLEMLIEAEAKTGYMATVKRAVDKEERLPNTSTRVSNVSSPYRQCFFTMESTAYKSRFLVQINNSFGRGGMSLAQNEAQFSMFIQ